MKNIPLSPILALFVLASLFSCTKDPQKPIAKDADLGHVLNMIQDKDGILHLMVSAGTFQGAAAKDRDGCTMYEAVRFTKANCSSMEVPPPNSSDDRVTVDTVRFRLVKINKSTNARTALINYITATNVGGLNVSWFNQSPLSDYWYATEFDKCGPTSSDLGTCPFFYISDFWGDDYLIQIDPWDCDNRRAAKFVSGPILGNSAQIIVRCSLNENCTISPVPLEDPCDF
ncbi:MAG: hypothetical protein KF734_21755 [Saprospiraceae bacterium]|nr:hypothetical protein [Saprospiraceae bacterium]